MLSSVLVSNVFVSLALTSITPSPSDGVTKPEVIEEMVRSNVSSMVSAEAQAKPVAADVIIPAADQGELSFFDIYFPFSLDDNLHPDIEDEKVTIWIITALLGAFAGPLWIPKAMTKLEPDADYMEEALINWLIHMGIFVLGYAGFVITIYFAGILGWVILIGNAAYLFPVATINSFNRHVGAGSGGGKKKKNKKGGGSDKSALQELPGMPEFASLNDSAAIAY